MHALRIDRNQSANQHKRQQKCGTSCTVNVSGGQHYTTAHLSSTGRDTHMQPFSSIARVCRPSSVGLFVVCRDVGIKYQMPPPQPTRANQQTHLLGEWADRGPAESQNWKLGHLILRHSAMGLIAVPVASSHDTFILTG